MIELICTLEPRPLDGCREDVPAINPRGPAKARIAVASPPGRWCRLATLVVLPMVFRPCVVVDFVPLSSWPHLSRLILPLTSTNTTSLSLCPKHLVQSYFVMLPPPSALFQRLRELQRSSRGWWAKACVSPSSTLCLIHHNTKLVRDSKLAALHLDTLKKRLPKL